MMSRMFKLTYSSHPERKSAFKTMYRTLVIKIHLGLCPHNLFADKINEAGLELSDRLKIYSIPATSAWRACHVNALVYVEEVVNIPSVTYTNDGIKYSELKK